MAGAVERAVNIEDLRRLAKRRLPRAVFDYIDGGADDEITLRDNCRAFDRIMFRPRCAIETPAVDLGTTVLGAQVSLPFLFGPVGSTRMFHPHGEEVAARVAGAAGTIYSLSTLSGTRLEEVRAATPGPAWYQVYLLGGREIATAMLERVKAAGYSTLLVTVDTPVAGMRERDLRNGVKEMLTRNPVTMFPYVWQYLARPRWLVGFLRDGGLMKFPNVVLPDGPMPYADVAAALEQSTVTWRDLRWIGDVWKGPIVVKGIHIGDDARRAIDEGASAVIVSNHGGRQLDGVPATIRALPEILDAVRGRVDVLLDGGIRRGSDVVKALCLGAKAVLIGRAYAFGLGAGGEAGVQRAVDILRADVIRTMKLLGCASVSQLDRSYVDAPAEWFAARDERQPVA
jgi:isopentenyl diphosphate isomerase/L-lactate dehydrogenase-like FMN-dependent dehydrogenase